MHFTLPWSFLAVVGLVFLGLMFLVISPLLYLARRTDRAGSKIGHYIRYALLIVLILFSIFILFSDFDRFDEIFQIPFIITFFLLNIFRYIFS